MTKKEVMLKAIEGRITWIQAAEILGITARHMRRIKTRYEEVGFDALRDYRAGKARRRRIPLATVEKVLTLRRTAYADLSVRRFWEHATERHSLDLSYTWTLLTLQAAGLAEKAPARGRYRRRRERRPMRGMLLYLDASTHLAGRGAPHGRPQRDARRRRRSHPLRSLLRPGRYGVDVRGSRARPWPPRAFQ